MAYARVSTNGQKDDLKNQIDFIRQFANAKGVILNETITDIGSGLNYNRKKWNKLLEEVMNNQIDTIFITYKTDLSALDMTGSSIYVKCMVLKSLCLIMLILAQLKKWLTI